MENKSTMEGVAAGGGGGGGRVDGVSNKRVKVEELQEEEPAEPQQEPRRGQQALQNNNEHPLLNHVIVENVFKICKPGSGAELAQYCLVNPVWYDVLLPRWNKLELPIKLCVADYPVNYKPPRRHPGTPTSMEEFMQVLETESLEERPVTRGIKQQHTVFELRLPRYRYDEKLLNCFWTQLGASMTKLTVRDYIFQEMGDLRSVLLLCRRTPNLESLDVVFTLREERLGKDKGVLVIEGDGRHDKLKCLKIGMRNWDPATPFKWKWNELLNYYPNLERLTLDERQGLWRQVKPCRAAINECQRRGDKGNNKKLIFEAV